jgi:hypothetical protein
MPQSSALKKQYVSPKRWYLLTVTQEKNTDFGRKQKTESTPTNKNQCTSTQCFPNRNAPDFGRILLPLDFCLGSNCQCQRYSPE